MALISRDTARQMLEPLPLCADVRRDAWLRPLVRQCVQFLLHEVGSHAIEAVILTGSAARCEASVLPTAAGFRLLGDIEFLVILRSPMDWVAVRREMLELSRRATHDVGNGGCWASIEYGPAGLAYLQRNIRPCIFAYDLRTHGQVLWGRQDILSEIRPFGVEAIAPEDALNLLMNRMIELSMLANPARAAGVYATQDRLYHHTKVMLDLAGSALAFAGRHVPRYSERGRGFRELLAIEPALPAALLDTKPFCTALDHAVICKSEPTEARLSSPHGLAAEQQQVTWGCQLWLWEMQRLIGRPVTGFEDALHAYIAHEPLARRLKGWAKFLLHPLRPPDALSWPRLARLLLRASPHTLTYATALLMQAAALGEAAPDWRQLTALSPVPLSVRNNAKAVQDIGTLWQWLVRNN